MASLGLRSHSELGIEKALAELVVDNSRIDEESKEDDTVNPGVS